MQIQQDSFLRARPVGLPDAIHPPVIEDTLWHGTLLPYAEQMLEDGAIRPAKSQAGHTCLTTDPAIAVFFARIHQTSIPQDMPCPPIALIRVDLAMLDPDKIVPETGSIEISPYGQLMPGRDKASLRAVQHDWKKVHDICACLGTTQDIPVFPDMIDMFFQDLTRFPHYTDNHGCEARIREEIMSGVPQDPEVRDALSRHRARQFRDARPSHADLVA